MKTPPHGYDVPCPMCGQLSPLTQELSQLTLREFEVLKLIIEGLTNKEIARSLGISEGTTKCHVTCLLRQFQVTTRVQAAVRGVFMIKEMRDKQREQAKVEGKEVAGDSEGEDAYTTD